MLIHYKMETKFWPTFWPKKHKILTEFGHFDRIFDRKSSVGKTFVEITFWPIGQKILTDFLTEVAGQNYILTEILTENIGQNTILTEILTENIGQNNILTDILTIFFGQNIILTDVFGQNFGQKFEFWPKIGQNSVKFLMVKFKKNYLQNSYYNYCNNYSVIIICL